MSEWERKKGELVSSEIVDDWSNGSADIVICKIVFKNGDSEKIIIYNNGDDVYVRAEGRWYLANSLFEGDGNESIETQSTPEPPGFEPTPPTGTGFTPGDSLEIVSASGKNITPYGTGIYKSDGYVNKSEFRGEAFSKGAQLSARGINVDLWNSFITGSFNGDDVLEIVFDYEYSGRGAAVVANANLKCRLIAWNVDEQEVEDQTFIFNHSIPAAGRWEGNDSGEETLFVDPSSNTHYEVGFRLKVETVATGGLLPSTATADVYSRNDDRTRDKVKINGIDISWR